MFPAAAIIALVLSIAGGVYVLRPDLVGAPANAPTVPSSAAATSASPPPPTAPAAATPAAAAATGFFYPQTIRPVTRVEWSMDKPFADYARAQHYPLVFTQSAVQNWTAIRKWSLPYLASSGHAAGFKSLDGVKVQDNPLFRYVNPIRLENWKNSPEFGTFRTRLYPSSQFRATKPVAVNTTIEPFVAHVTGRDTRSIPALIRRIPKAGASTVALADANKLFLYFSDGISILPRALFADMQPFDFFDFGASRNAADAAVEAARAAAIAQNNAKKPPKNGKPKSAKRLAKEQARIDDAVADALDAVNRCDYNIWLGAKGVTAYPHYDADTNFFAQISGTKRFILAAPQAHSVVGLYPSFHPLYRQTVFDRMDTSPPATRAREATEVSSDTAPLELFEAVLNPGDVLYLPPYWFHRVTSIDDSISINSWCRVDSVRHYERASTLPLPFEDDYPYTLSIHAVHQYIEQFLNQLYEPDRMIAREVIDRLLASRYDSLPGVRAKPLPKSECKFPNPELANDPKADPAELPLCGSRTYSMGGVPVKATMSAEQLAKNFQPGVDRLLDLFELKPVKNARSTDQPQPMDQRRAIRDIHVFNYIEEMVQWAVGPDYVIEYLQCCF